MRHVVFTLCVILLAFPALAVTPGERLDDPVLEQRAREISRELRCVVCQNQSIDDSDATLARDLRTIVRERVVAGDSNEQVIDFVVARYGEFVLLKPRLGAHTRVLWAAPFLVLLAASLLAIWFVRRRNTRPVEAPLSEVEQARLAAILGPEEQDRGAGNAGHGTEDNLSGSPRR